MHTLRTEIKGLTKGDSKNPIRKFPKYLFGNNVLFLGYQDTEETVVLIDLNAICMERGVSIESDECKTTIKLADAQLTRDDDVRSFQMHNGMLILFTSNKVALWEIKLTEDARQEVEQLKVEK